MNKSYMHLLAYFGGNKSVTKKLDTSWPNMNLFQLDNVIDLIKRGVLSCYGEGLEVIKSVENQICELTGAKYSLFLNSGTSALLLAFFSCNLKPGDEVIVPSYTYPATLTPLYHFGVKIVLADIEEDSYNISIKAIQRCISEKTKMIVVTHMRGLPVDMLPLIQICKREKIFLVEDASHALGAIYEGKHVGNWGDFGCFSLSSDKIVSGGTAGFIITNNLNLYQTIHSAVYGPGREGGMDFNVNDYSQNLLRGIVETGIGINFKSSPINAAIVSSQLKFLENTIKVRNHNLLGFSDMLENTPGIIIPKSRENSTRGGWYGYRPFYDQKALRGLKKEWFIKLLQAEGVEVSGTGIKPFYMYSIVNDSEIQTAVSFQRISGDMFRLDPGGFANTDSNHERTLKFPVSNAMDALITYRQYADALMKIYLAINELPKEMFE